MTITGFQYFHEHDWILHVATYEDTDYWTLQLTVTFPYDNEFLAWTTPALYLEPPDFWNYADVDQIGNLTVVLLQADGWVGQFAYKNLDYYATPEPAAALLFGIGLALLSRWLRR